MVDITVPYGLSLFQNMKENPIHIINVSIKQADTEDDDALVKAFTAFANSKVSTLKSCPFSCVCCSMT